MSVSPLSPQPPIDPRTSPKPAAVKDAAPAAPPSATSDRVTISAAGHAALAKDQAAPVQPAHASPAASGITNDQALQLGKALQRSNPAHFKQADINGDGKLSAAEAREAGLKA